jgi:hypothetical protein
MKKKSKNILKIKMNYSRHLKESYNKYVTTNECSTNKEDIFKALNNLNSNLTYCVRYGDFNDKKSKKIMNDLVNMEQGIRQQKQNINFLLEDDTKEINTTVRKFLIQIDNKNVIVVVD